MESFPQPQPQRRPPIPTPFFYGWVIVGVGILVSAVGSTASNVFTASTISLITGDLGWTRTQVTIGVTAASLVGAAVSPFIGRATDRVGPRVLMPAGAAVFGAGMLIISRMTSLWQFYVGYVLARSIGSACMGGLVAQASIVNWFIRMRGRTMGLASMAFPVSQSVLVPALQWFATSGAGWRGVYGLIALAAVLLGGIPAALFIRRRPEEVGLHPDGDATPPSSRSTALSERRAVRARDFSFLAGEAVRTRSFWFLVTGQVCSILASGSVSFHLSLFFIDRGLTPALAALTISFYAFFGGVSSGVWGFLSERYSERFLAMGIQSIGACAIVLMLAAGNSVPVAMALAGMYGFASRGDGTLYQLLLANYYGRGHYGTISGLFNPFPMVALGVGPLVAAVSYDLMGSYATIWWVFAGLHLMAVFFLLLARQPALPLRAG